MFKSFRQTIAVAAVAVAAIVLPAGGAGAVSHDLVIKNKAARAFTICKNWNEKTGICATSSPRGVLYKGENSLSKYRWADTDGIWIPANCILFSDPNRTYVVKAVGVGMWRKTGGGPGTGPVGFEVYC